jgi:predicted SAM-dependent methyltransferase
MKRYLNLGCGDRFHPNWTNVDLAPRAPGIIKHDLSRPLPFADNEFDAVYLGHVLEHFNQSDGLCLLAECNRVCTLGSVIRVVVPDLEMITRLYLKYLEDAVAGNDDSVYRYNWMVLELYDQIVRTKSGGETAGFIRRSSPELSSFLQGRIGVKQYASLR